MSCRYESLVESCFELKCNMIEYSVNEPKTLDWKELLSFLQETDDLIVPPISSRIDLEEYAKKITENAVVFAARDEESLIGVAAVYYNPYPGYSYSTYFCVKKAYRKIDMVGIKLEELQKEYWTTHWTKGIRFAIRKSNKALVRYHQHNGAKIVSEEQYPDSDITELHMEIDF